MPFDPITGGISAGAAIGGAIVQHNDSEEGRRDAWYQWVQNRLDTDQHITNARDYNTKMSNTAHQREMADMRAAGINPMLSGMGGQGATSPTSPSGAGGVGNQPQISQRGKMLSEIIPSALSAQRTVADIKNVDKDTYLKEASAINQIAQSNQATSSAAEAQERTTQLQRERDAKGAEADARKNKARLDLNYNKAERLLNMGKTTSGIVSDAGSAVWNLLPSKALGKGIGKAYQEGMLKGLRHGVPIP